MRAVLFLWVLLFCSNAYADRVLLEKSTGKLIEYQSDAREGTLLKNIQDNPQYGYTTDQVEEKEVTEAEWASLKKKWIDDPSEVERKAKESVKKQKETQIKQKLNLTDAEFEALKEAVR